MNARSSLSTLAIGLAVALAAPTFARADDAAPTAGDRAVELGRQGVELYNQQRWVEAHDRFVLAERAAHSPVFVLYMARCKRQLGDLLTARDWLERAADEELPLGAPDAWQRAQAEARGELDALSERIPSIRVEVTGAPEASVEVDGRRLGDAESRHAIALNPGTRLIVARAGARSARISVDVAEGDRERVVRLDLGRASKPPEAPPPSEGDRSEGWIVAGATLVGLGGAGILVGAVTGGLALDKASAIKENCIDRSCLKRDAEEGETTTALATASTFGFVLGGAAAVAGIALLVVSLATSDDDESAALLLAPTSAGLRVGF